MSWINAVAGGGVERWVRLWVAGNFCQLYFWPIILFERPIRMGDTITIGNLHGTVSQIRIRATTVTDFDRKEIIIPNKTFVTDQLINCRSPIM